MSKKAWKRLDVSLQFSTKSNFSADENDSQLSDVNSIRSSLPTETNSTRQTAELENIPENGPFILIFANMPFEATEKELRQFFHAYDIRSVELNNPRKGCGHIEFMNLQDLSGAWKMNEKPFLNRSLRLSIPLKDDASRQQATGFKPKFQSPQKPPTFDSDDSENWRKKQSQPSIPKPAAQQKDSSASSLSRSSFKAAAPTGWRTSSMRENQSSSSSAWRPDRVARGDGSQTEADSDSNWRSNRGNTEGRLSVREENKVVETVAVATAVAVASAVAADVPGKSAKKIPIFGDARPVDTLVKDLEIENKIMSKKLAVAEAAATIVTTAPKQSAWAIKRPLATAVTSIATTATAPATTTVSEPPTTTTNPMPEWRENSGAQRLRLISNTSTTSIATQTPAAAAAVPKKAEPRPAPPPQKNVWEERKKSRTAGQVSGPLTVPVPVVSMAAAAESASVPVPVPEPQQRSNHCEQSATAIATSTATVSTPSIATAAEKVAPVVISVNGPYLDPKSRPASSHPHGNSSTPTAVAVSKARTEEHSVSVVARPTSMASAVAGAAGTTSSSMWTRGPPQGLINPR